MALLIGKLVYDWVMYIDVGDIANPFVLIWVAVSVALAPYVVNIGFGVNLGAKPRYLLILIWSVGAIAGYLVEGVVVGRFLWATVEATQIYIYGHLGVSFLLSAILATPGCEMRAIPHLFGKISGSGSKEHYCPGFIDKVDRWERRRRQGS